MQSIKARIYGDSIMKGTVLDPGYRYHAVMGEYLEKFKSRFNVEVENRSRFGSTIERGYGVLHKDIEDGIDCDYAVIEFGGNDCNYKWNEISVDPEGEHHPLTAIERFKDVYSKMVQELKAKNITPVMMTLPPIDAERYLEFLDRNGNNGRNILKWLGDAQRIYRFHELYSGAIKDIAVENDCPLVDVRPSFLSKPSRNLICVDGLHPTREGYKLICDAFESYAERRLGSGAFA